MYKVIVNTGQKCIPYRCKLQTFSGCWIFIVDEMIGSTVSTNYNEVACMNDKQHNINYHLKYSQSGY